MDEWSTPGAYDLPSLVPPGFTWFPGVTLPPPVTVGDCNSSGANYVTAIFNPSTLTGGTAEVSSYFYYPCKIRDDGSTYIYMEIVTYGDAGDNLTCYAVDAGQNRILTGSIVKPGEGGNTTSYWWLQYTASAGGLDVAGFELVLAAGVGVPQIDGVITTTLAGLTSLTTAGLGNTVTNDVLVETQINPYLVKTDYQVTFVNNNGIYQGFSDIDQVLTTGVGSPNIHVLHYYTATPLTGNPVYWRIPTITAQKQDLIYSTDGLDLGDTTIRVDTNFNNGLTGTFIVSGQVYWSANAMIDNTRRAVLKDGILANVCAVG